MPTPRSLRNWYWLTCVLALVAQPVAADDWPQWMGPHRDGRWNESSLIERLPEGDAPTTWKRELGGGYSGPAVAGGGVFVTDFVSTDPPPANHPGVRDLRRGQERVWCLAADTGEVRWRIERSCTCQMSYAGGPRATPTVADGLVYCLGAAGYLQCLQASDGTELWAHDLTRYTGAPPWSGFSSHPLVEGDLVLCLVGGPGSAVVAFDRKTGVERWRSGSASDPGYSSIQSCDHEGQRLLLAWDADHLRGLEPNLGTELWRFPLAPQFKMSIAMPQVSGDIVFAGGKGRVSAALRLVNGGRAVEPLWRATATTGLSTSNAPPILDEGVIYGCDCDTGHLRGIDLQTGERLWESLQPTTGGRPSPHATVFLVRNGPRWILFNDSGDLIFAELSRHGYTELSRTHAIDPTDNAYGRRVVWSHPAFSGGRVFVRSQKEIKCLDLRATQPSPEQVDPNPTDPAETGQATAR